MSDLCFASIAQLGRAYAAREVSPVDVVEAHLARIAALDGSLRAYVTLAEGEAREAARASERRHAHGRPLGPLDGMPLGLKDNYDTAGIRTTACCPLYAERIPELDAEVVRRLRSAGAVLLGKHKLGELAIGGLDPDGLFPAPRNPWASDRVTGGSSSGSAVAVAAGLSAGALATDTGGSIRWPAAMCGIVGLKPTFGLVSTRGIVPLSWSMDNAGPLARTAEDAATLLEAVADSGRLAGARTEGVAGLRVGAPLADLERAHTADPAVIAAYHGALVVLRRQGAVVVPIALPAEMEHVRATCTALILADALARYRPHAQEAPERFGRRFYMRLLEATAITAADHVNALRARARIARAMARAMRDLDVIAVPTALHPAWRADDEARLPVEERVPHARVFSLTGQPAVSVPCGFSAEGLPIGLQLAARPFDDLRALAVARAYETATGWSARRPQIKSVEMA